jgi:hypothetical protein
LTAGQDWEAVFASSMAQTQARLEGVLGRLRGLAAEAEADEEADEEAAGAADAGGAGGAGGDQFAEAARSGEYGRDWRRVQERVDRGRTSLEEVFSGRDTTPEAVALRRGAQDTLGRQLSSWKDQLEDDPTADNPLTEVAGLAASFQERAARLAERLGDS